MKVNVVLMIRVQDQISEIGSDNVARWVDVNGYLVHLRKSFSGILFDVCLSPVNVLPRRVSPIMIETSSQALPCTLAIDSSDLFGQPALSAPSIQSSVTVVVDSSAFCQRSSQTSMGTIAGDYKAVVIGMTTVD